jgi:hypothetical protein
MKPKITAADIKKEPKPRFGLNGTAIGSLHGLGREIRVRIEKLDFLGVKAVDQIDSINKLLDEARKLCDESGFEEFKRSYCPELGKSRTYELLAVKEGRKTLEQIRADGRRRVAEHRARKLEKAKQTAEKNNVTEKSSVTEGGGHASDLPEDAAPDERALDWARGMFLRIDQDCKDEDIDRCLGFRALSKILGEELQQAIAATGDAATEDAPAPAEPPAKKRGRPVGSKNKPKPETAEAKPQDQTTGNSVDPEQSAGEMAAKFTAMDAKKAETTAAAALAPVATDDGSIPPFHRREQAAERVGGQQ